MEGVPTRFTAKCAFCGYELDTRKRDTLREVAGWADIGTDDNFSVVERFNRWAHERCVKNAERDRRKPS
jgi:hypothetical protein